MLLKVSSQHPGENSRRGPRIFRNATIASLYLLSISSLVYIVSIIAFYLHAKSVLGYFPTFDNPDPGRLVAYKTYTTIIEPSFKIWAICLLVWTLLVLLIILTNRKFISSRHIVLSSIGHIIALTITFSPIFGWYVD